MEIAQSSGTRRKTASTSRKPSWPHFSEAEIRARLSLLGKLARESSLHGFLLSSPENVGYFTGLYLKGVRVLILPGELILYANPLALEEASLYLPPSLPAGIEDEKVFWQGNSLPAGVGIGVENSLPSSELRRLSSTFTGREFTVTDAPFRARAVKSPAEITFLRRAGRILARSRNSFLECLESNTSEAEAVDLFSAILSLNGAREAFETVYAAGAASSFPHAVPRKRVPGKREWVVFDHGARLAAYCSDSTRVLFLDRLSRPERGYLDLLKRARDAALKKARPGARASSVDKAAREVIASAGAGKYFIHGLGHGVGLSVHEYPTINPSSRQLLREGMVFTVEPGVYLPGRGGLRIEDTYLMSSAGLEKITGQ